MTLQYLFNERRRLGILVTDYSGFSFHGGIMFLSSRSKHFECVT